MIQSGYTSGRVAIVALVSHDGARDPRELEDEIRSIIVTSDLRKTWRIDRLTVLEEPIQT